MLNIVYEKLLFLSRIKSTKPHGIKPTTFRVVSTILTFRAIILQHVPLWPTKFELLFFSSSFSPICVVNNLLIMTHVSQEGILATLPKLICNSVLLKNKYLTNSKLLKVLMNCCKMIYIYRLQHMCKQTSAYYFKVNMFYWHSHW